MPKPLIEQAESLLKKHLALGVPKSSVSTIGQTKYKKFTSVRSYIESTQTLARIAKDLGVQRIKQITPFMAQQRLLHRQQTLRSGSKQNATDNKSSTLVSQKTLDAERKALSIFLEEPIARTYSSVSRPTNSRSYTNDQVLAIQQHQSPKGKLATQIALEAGLRAKELITIQRANELRITYTNKWHHDRFTGITGQKYVVVGKGGLVREVYLTDKTAQQLEQFRRHTPLDVVDRKVKYTSYYDITSGNAFSASFSQASKRALGWSNGAHGLRHQYVQGRVSHIISLGYSAAEAKKIVSQEVGHFRASIVNIYLR